jgi:cytochrome c oxidase assembly protein subunit 20
MKDVLRVSCAKEAYLQGIIVGSLIGLIRYGTTKRVMSSCNYAVITFGLASIISWEYCRWNSKEQHKVAKAVVELNQKKLKEVHEYMKEKEKKEAEESRELRR